MVISLKKKTVFVGHEILMPQNLFKFIGLLFTTTQDFYTNSSSELSKVLELGNQLWSVSIISDFANYWRGNLKSSLDTNK